MWLTLRLTGAVVGAVGAIWLIAGYAYAIALDFRLVKALSAVWHVWLLKGPFLGALGSLIGPALYVVGRDFSTEQRWRRGARRGIAILHSLRLAEPACEGARQELACTLEADIAGLAPVRADYRARVGPMEARLLVEGVALACEANPVLLPGRVRVWLTADPLDRELTGRHLDFEACAP